jgi:predicted GH43/DUF377 family glycosyl hydrolase
MIVIIKHGIILEKSNQVFECDGVLNPAVIKHDGVIHMFYRAVNKGNYSTIGYCTLKHPLEIGTRMDSPLLIPEHPYESKGMEDPRIVNIDGEFMITYTAYDGFNALGALVVSKDLKTYTKKGIIVPKLTYPRFSELAESKKDINEKYLRYNEHWKSHGIQDKKFLLWDKNLIFFPEKINGYFYFMHRIKPDILITRVKSLEDLTPTFWIDYFMHFQDCIMISPKHTHEISYVGGGCPPIKTTAGWLVIYHGVHDEIEGYIYSACAALFELDNPCKEIARLSYPLFQPIESWEKKGIVNNVCFPSGAIVEEDTLYIYYGAADERIGCASIRLSSLIAEILTYTN